MVDRPSLMGSDYSSTERYNRRMIPSQMTARSRLAVVAAIGRNRELGVGNKLLWHIPDDLKRFKMLTKGHSIIMGRKTFESIASYIGGPLPDRENIVVTRNKKWSYGGVLVAHSLDEALKIAKQQLTGVEEIYIVGGAQLYKEALPYIDTLYLTLIDAEAPEADAFFPEYEGEFVKKVFEAEREWNGLKYRWVNLER